MPCRSDHMHPTVKERQIQEAAKLYLYVAKKLDSYKRNFNIDYAVPVFIRKDATNEYAKNERCMTELCGLLTELKQEHPKYFEKIVYNAKNKMSRRLADWWEEHLEEDKKRKRLEKKDRSQAVIERLSLASRSEEEFSFTEKRFKNLEGLSIEYDGGRLQVFYKGETVYENLRAGNDFNLEIRKAKNGK